MATSKTGPAQGGFSGSLAGSSFFPTTNTPAAVQVISWAHHALTGLAICHLLMYNANSLPFCRRGATIPSSCFLKAWGMPCSFREEASAITLQELPNIGPRLAENLRRAGLETPESLRRRGPGRLSSASGPRWTPRPAFTSSPPWPGRSWASPRRQFPRRKRRTSGPFSTAYNRIPVR